SAVPSRSRNTTHGTDELRSELRDRPLVRARRFREGMGPLSARPAGRRGATLPHRRPRLHAPDARQVMLEGSRCGYTTPHHVDARGNDQPLHGLESTGDAHAIELTRRNIGTCAISPGLYIGPTRFEGKGRDLAS